MLHSSIAGRALVALIALAVALGAAPTRAHAGIEYVNPIVAGSGFSFAYVQVEFFEGEAFLFQVHFNDETSGFNLLEIIADDPDVDFILEYTAFPFGNFVTGLGYDGFYDSGDGSGGDDFWRYWVRDDHDEEWMSAPFGPDDRIASQGTWDGWVFGRDDLPKPLLPIPSPGALALLAMLGLGSRRRRQR